MRARRISVMVMSLWCAVGTGTAQEMTQPAVTTSPAAGMAQLEAQFAGEPSLPEIYSMAERQLGIRPDLVNKWLRRAGKRYWLPDLRVTGRWADSFSERPAFSFRANPDRTIEREELNFTRGDSSYVLVSGLWRLPETMFDRLAYKDIAVTAQRYQRMRMELLRDVSQVYYERRRLQLELLANPPGSFYARALIELRIQELAAHLDIVSGGGFTRRGGSR
jgi:hypothetical protein